MDADVEALMDTLSSTTAPVAAPPALSLADLSEPAPPPGPADWNCDGVAIYPAMIPRQLIANYLSEWRLANGFHGIDHRGVLEADRPGGWPDCTPYMRHPALAALVCDPRIAAAVEALIGEPAGVHLNLSGLTSTMRDWHCDSYLNEPEVGDHYAAVWIALGDVSADMGPFQYVPGSHRWPQVTRELIGRHVDLADPAWPTRSEAILSPLYEAELARTGARVVTHCPRRGDVLIWHGRLLHRGSRPPLPNTYRPALIAHYSGIGHRPQMPPARRHLAGGWLFPIQSSGPVR